MNATNIRVSLVILLLPILLISCGSSPAVAPAGPQTVALSLFAADGTPLALHATIPEHPRFAVIFLHRIGSHGLAETGTLIRSLTEAGMAVYCPDMRGHGLSGGERGHSPSIEQPWRDIKQIAGYVSAQHPDIPLLMAAHSTGCGLLLNYCSWEEATLPDGLVFLSPYFGFRSETEQQKQIFFTVDMKVMANYSLSGWQEQGQSPVAEIMLPENLDREPLSVHWVSCFLFSAFTPKYPRLQIDELDIPYIAVAGLEDRKLVPGKVANLLSSTKDNQTVLTIPEENHESVLDSSLPSFLILLNQI